MLNLIKDTLGLVEDIITTPTDMLGLTNFSDKKSARNAVELMFASGEINRKEYEAMMAVIDNSPTLNL